MPTGQVRKARASGFKRCSRAAGPVGYLDDVLSGTANAPWLWWVVALVVILGLLLLGMKLLGLFPE